MDMDNDGILSSEQFTQLYKDMNIGSSTQPDKFKKEVSAFLDTLDPYSCDKIIFSDIV